MEKQKTQWEKDKEQAIVELQKDGTKKSELQHLIGGVVALAVGSMVLQQMGQVLSDMDKPKTKEEKKRRKKERKKLGPRWPS